MKHRIPAVGVLGLALIATLQVPVTGATPSDDEIADALRFRRTFHLSAGEELVRRSFVDRTSFPDDAWGVPLTIDEAADMAARLQRQDAATEAFEWAARQSGFGGAYIDQSLGAMPVLQFTDGLVAASDRIADLLPDHPFRVERVQRTYSELVETGDRAFADVDTLHQLGVIGHRRRTRRHRERAAIRGRAVIRGDTTHARGTVWASSVPSRGQSDRAGLCWV